MLPKYESETLINKPTRFSWQETKPGQFHSGAWGVVAPKSVCPCLSKIRPQTLNCTSRARVRKVFLFYALRKTRTRSGALSKLLCIEAFLHHLCCLGLCYRKSGHFKKRKTSKCPFRRAMERGVAPVSVLPWSLLAPDSTRKRTTSRCPFWAAM